MIDLGHMYGDSGECGNSTLAHYVRQRLPKDDMVNEADLRWLDSCDDSLKGPATNESVTAATRDALAANPRGHIDPCELLIDADICDTKCEPRLCCSLNQLGAVQDEERQHLPHWRAGRSSAGHEFNRKRLIPVSRLVARFLTELHGF